MINFFHASRLWIVCLSVGTLFFALIPSSLSANNTTNSSSVGFTLTPCVIPIGLSSCQLFDRSQSNPMAEYGKLNNTGVPLTVLDSSIVPWTNGSFVAVDIIPTKSGDYGPFFNNFNATTGYSASHGGVVLQGGKSNPIVVTSGWSGGSTLRDVTILARFDLTPTCAPGSVWDPRGTSTGGSIGVGACIATNPATGASGRGAPVNSFSVDDCVIKRGESYCHTTGRTNTFANRILTAYMENKESGMPTGYYERNGLSGDANDPYLFGFGQSDTVTTIPSGLRMGLRTSLLGYLESGRLAFGTSQIELRDIDGTVVARTTARATCEPGTIWTFFPTNQLNAAGRVLGPRYCLPPFTQTPAGSTTQTRQVQSQYRQLDGGYQYDPEFGNVEGYCDPGQKWLPNGTATIGGKSYTKYACQFNPDPVKPSDVDLVVPLCTIIADSAGSATCSTNARFVSSLDRSFYIEQKATLPDGSSPSVFLSQFTIPYTFNNYSERDYNKGNLQQASTPDGRTISNRIVNDPGHNRVNLHYGTNTFSIYQIIAPDNAIRVGFDPKDPKLTRLVKTVTVELDCPAGQTFIRGGCRSSAEVTDLTKDGAGEFDHFSSIVLNGQDIHSMKQLSLTTRQGTAPTISGKISIPTRETAFIGLSMSTCQQCATALRNGKATLTVRNELTQKYIEIPVQKDGTFDIKNTTTPQRFRNEFFSVGQNLIRFEVTYEGAGSLPFFRTFIVNVSYGTSSSNSNANPQSGVVLPDSNTIINTKGPETQPVEPRTGTNTTSTTDTRPTTTSTNTSTTVVDKLDLDTSSLDQVSKNRIDAIITRLERRISKMSYQIALRVIDNATKRIQDLPNKTTKAKLIDAYTLSKLQDLRKDLIAKNEDDYIGRIDAVVSE